MNITNINDKIIHNLIRLSLVGDVSVTDGWSTSIKYKNGQLKQITSHQSSVVSIRLVKNGCLGVAATNQMSEQSLKTVIDNAIEVAPYSRQANFDLPVQENKLLPPKTFDPTVIMLTDNQILERGRKIVEMVKKELPEFIIIEMEISKSVAKSIFTNTNGVFNGKNSTGTGFGLEVSNIKEGDFYQCYIGNESVKDDLDCLFLVKKLIVRIKQGRKVTKINSSRYPVIFIPECIDTLLAYFLTALNGRTVNEKSSKFVGQLNKKLFDTRLTLVDDPTLDWGLGSYLLDDEGVLGYRKELIKSGRVNQFYYDLNQAALAKVKSTGNGVRLPNSQAEPGTSNIIINGGSEKYEDLIKNIKEGLLVYGFIGGGQGNPYNGDFQLGIQLGYKVERGEIVGRVKDTAISGNVFDLFRDNLLWLSKEEETWGSLTVPYICLDQVTVTTK